jgi:hypothetical protein
MRCRSFTLNHLAQIEHLKPHDYSLRPIRIIHEGQRIESLQIGFPNEDRELPDATQSPASKPTKIATAAQIEERKQSFHNKLIDIVKTNHDVSNIKWGLQFSFNTLRIALSLPVIFEEVES